MLSRNNHPLLTSNGKAVAGLGEGEVKSVSLAVNGNGFLFAVTGDVLRVGDGSIATLIRARTVEDIGVGGADDQVCTLYYILRR